MLEDNKAEQLIVDIKKYISLNYVLIKLKTIERTSKVLSNLFSSILILLVLLLFVFFISLAAGFYLSAILDSKYLGFAIVGGFYFLVSIILILIKKKHIEGPIRDKFIKDIFNEN